MNMYNPNAKCELNIKMKQLADAVYMIKHKQKKTAPKKELSFLPMLRIND